MLSAFGTKTVPPQPVFKALPALFESKDGKAREKVKDLVVSAPAQSTPAQSADVQLPSQHRGTCPVSLGAAAQSA